MGEKIAQANPLEQFTLLAKNAKGAAAVELVKQALEASGVYVFGELLDMQNIQDLGKSPSTSPYLDLLKIFAYETYSTCFKQGGGLAEMLTSGMVRKLRLLTLVTMAETKKVLPYAALLTELELSSVRELEDLIIEGISAGIILGKLDQKSSYFEVDFVIGRDIKQSDFAGITAVLSNWCLTCDAMLSSIEYQATRLNREKVEHNDHLLAVEEKMAEIKQTIKNQPNMDIEDPDSRMDTERVDSRSTKKAAKGKALRPGGKGGFWQK